MKKLSVVLFFILAILILLPVTASAQIGDPSILEVTGVDVYTGVVEDTDQLYIIDFEIQYPTNPGSYTADELFLLRLLDNTGSQLGVTTPVSTGTDNGYAEGMSGMYFSAAEVSNLGMTFSGNGYYMQITGNPLAHWTSGTPPTQNYISFNNYYTQNIQDQLHLRLSVQIQLLENDWDIDLIEGTAGERILTSPEGEEYFTAAIPNLRLFCPDIFGAALVRTDYPDREIITDYYMGGDSAGTLSYANVLLAQTFTPNMDYELETLSAKMNRIGACGDVALQLWTAAGTPIAMVRSGTVFQADIEIAPARDWETGPFGEYDVDDANQYAIVLDCPSGSPTAYVSWRYDVSGDYPDGSAWYSTDDGATWIQLPNWDFQFQTGAKGADNLSGIRRLEHQLDGTIWDTSSSEIYIGLSSSWFRSLIWMVLAAVVTWMVASEANNTKSITPVWFYFVAAGYPISMVDPYVAIAALVMGSAATVWALMGNKA